MKTTDLERTLLQGSITELHALYLAKKLSVVDAVTWFQSRIQSISQTGPAINAVREVSARALEDARLADAAIAADQAPGPLHGIPVLLKDNILTAGMNATAGAAALALFKPRQDAVLVRRLRSAGAIVLGKTNLTEFADFVSDVMPSGYSGAGGVVKNPHGIEYGRGQGSSVGSAASVAASLCLFAIGSETQNSIQTPASYSSVAGYKPGVGVVSRTGVVPLVTSQDSPGPLARSVEDAALIGWVLAGADVRDTASLFAQGTLPGSLRADSRGNSQRIDIADAIPARETCCIACHACIRRGARGPSSGRRSQSGAPARNGGAAAPHCFSRSMTAHAYSEDQLVEEQERHVRENIATYPPMICFLKQNPGFLILLLC